MDSLFVDETFALSVPDAEGDGTKYESISLVFRIIEKLDWTQEPT